ncbi:MAG TPA: hypothetical protein VIK72_16735 [Clostridiaceae bacterium]
MTKQLWINLPVKDVKKSKEFFIKLGFSDIDGHRWNMIYMDMSKMPQ